MVALGMVYGLLLVVAGACANGVFTVPLKFINGWEWENAWLIYSLVGTLILPWALVGITIPDIVEVYSAAHWVEVAMCAGFGLGWGFGGVIFGICVDLIGNALTFSLVLGLTSCIGSLAPFIINGGDLHSTEALLNYTALGFVLVGLCFITVAGVFKDKQQSAALRTLEEAMGTGENLSLSARQELRAIFDETTGLTRKLAAMSSSTMPLSATAVSAVVDEALGLLRQAADVSVALDDSNQSGISERYSYGLADDYAPDIGVGGARSGVLSYSDSSANRASPLLKSSQLSVWGRDDSGDDTAFNRSPRASDLSVRSARGGGGDGGGTRGGGCCSGAAGKSAFGIVLAIIGGILSPCINFPLAFVHSIPNTARAHGASKVMAPNTVWCVHIVLVHCPHVIESLTLPLPLPFPFSLSLILQGSCAGLRHAAERGVHSLPALQERDVAALLPRCCAAPLCGARQPQRARDARPPQPLLLRDDGPALVRLKHSLLYWSGDDR
jgi:hypothetical protein